MWVKKRDWSHRKWCLQFLQYSSSWISYDITCFRRRSTEYSPAHTAWCRHTQRVLMLTLLEPVDKFLLTSVACRSNSKTSCHSFLQRIDIIVTNLQKNIIPNKNICSHFVLRLFVLGSQAEPESTSPRQHQQLLLLSLHDYVPVFQTRAKILIP